MIRKTAALAAAGCVFFCLLSPAAHAIDGVALEAGYGDDETILLRFAVQARWQKQIALGESWRLSGYWDFAIGVWHNAHVTTPDFGITPVFRFERDRLYVELAIGAHLVEQRWSDTRVTGSSFQFGDHVGIGMRGREYDLGVALQHLSNGGVKSPNPGINFVLVRLQYHLR